MKIDTELPETTVENIKEISTAINTEMNFFQQLAAAGHVDFSFRIMQKNAKLTININPGGTPRSLLPMNFTGTPADLDAEFFKQIIPAVQEVTGLVSNIEDVKQQAAELPKKAEKTAPVKAGNKKKAAPKKEAKPKPEKNKPEPIKEPELF